MRSIPAAMTWEILRRGRWSLITVTLAALALPVLLLAALRRDGQIDRLDESMLIMNVVVMINAMLLFGSGLYAAQGKISQLYAYPARSSELVAWRFLPMMVIAFIQVVICVSVVNLIFGMGWPVLGPALFAPVAMVTLLSVSWLTEKSTGWLIVAIALVSFPLGLWFRSRFGGTFSNPMRYWDNVTPADFVTMLSIAVSAYFLAVFAVTRNRRGEPPISLGVVAWFDRTFSFTSNQLSQLKTPLTAQCWFEWRRKGWVMPLVVLILIVGGLLLWFVGGHSTSDLFEAFTVGGLALNLAAFMGGVLLGNTGRNDSDFAMGHFLATRPISDVQFGRAIIRTTLKSIFLSWSMWLVAYLVVCLCMLASGAGESMKLPNGWKWWYFAATLIGPWIIAGNLATLGLSSTPKLLVVLTCILTFSFTAIEVVAKFLLSRELQLLLDQTIATSVSAVLIIVCVWIYFAAYQRHLIRKPTITVAATLWIAATAIWAIAAPVHARPYWFSYVLTAAAYALLIIPIAGIPLALSSNRHR